MKGQNLKAYLFILFWVWTGSLFGNDFQTSDGSGFITNTITRGSDKIIIKYYTRGCQSLKEGGSCSVRLTYSGSGVLRRPLAISFSPSNFQTTISKCGLVAEAQTECDFVVKHQSGTPTASLAQISVEGVPFSTLATFHTRPAPMLGASVGIPPVVKSLGISIAENVFGSVASDAISSLLGIGSDGPTEAQFEELTSKVDQISQTVNLILKDVVEIPSVVYQSFEQLNQYLTQQNLTSLVTELTQIITGSSFTYDTLENIIVTNPNPSACPPTTTYLTEDQVATTSDAGGVSLTTLIAKNLPCAIGAGGAGCSGLETAYNNAQSLIGTASGGTDPGFGVQNFATTLFQAVNASSLAVLNNASSYSQAGFPSKIFQQNNETITLYAYLISAELQRSYNVMHLLLYLAQGANNEQGVAGYNQLIFPVPGMSVDNNYETNLTILNNAYIGYANQLSSALSASIMTDNPGNPSTLSSFGNSAALSPKLLTAALTQIPAGSSWLNNCNIYEWAGALPSGNAGTTSVQCVNNPYGTPANSLSPYWVVSTPPVSEDYLGTLTNSDMSARCYQAGAGNNASIQFSACGAVYPQNDQNYGQVMQAQIIASNANLGCRYPSCGGLACNQPGHPFCVNSTCVQCRWKSDCQPENEYTVCGNNSCTYSCGHGGAWCPPGTDCRMNPVADEPQCQRH